MHGREPTPQPGGVVVRAGDLGVTPGRPLRAGPRRVTRGDRMELG